MYFRGEPKKSTDNCVELDKNPVTIMSISPHSDPEIMVNNVGHKSSLYLFFKISYLLSILSLNVNLLMDVNVYITIFVEIELYFLLYVWRVFFLFFVQEF